MLEILQGLGIIVALFLGVDNNRRLKQSDRRRREKIVNVVYYHVRQALENLQSQEKGNQLIRDQINQGSNSYTPYVVKSPAGDLTYDHVIQVMEWLDKDGEIAVSRYFHAQMGLHAVGKSFDLDFVRGWPQERKMRLWHEFEKFQRDTLKYAEETKSILDDHKFIKRKHLQKTSRQSA